MTAQEEQTWLESLRENKHALAELLKGKAVICEKKGALPGAPVVEALFIKTYDATQFVRKFPKTLLNSPIHPSTEDTLRDNLEYYQLSKVEGFTMRVSPENFSQIFPDIDVIKLSVRSSREQMEPILAELRQESGASVEA